MTLSRKARPGSRVIVEGELISPVATAETPDGLKIDYVKVRFRGFPQPITVTADVVSDPPKQQFDLNALDFDATRTKIAVNIREARQRLNMSQAQLAETIGVSQNAVSQWENGYCVPRFYTVPALTGALGITPEELYGDIK